MSLQNLENAYEILYQSVELLQNELHISFYEGYVEQLELILGMRSIHDLPFSEDGKKQWLDYAEKFEKISLAAEEKRKVSQLVLLKGATIDPLQANHQLTPDSIGYLMVYLIEQLVTTKELRLLDPAVGTGNLLSTVTLNLELAGRKVESIGIDIDDLLLKIASLNAEWFEMPLHLFHQDAVQPLLTEPVDVVISDLPIGYYPLDEQVVTFKTHHDNDHSYAHHVLIESAMRCLKEDGFGLFLVPANLLSSEQSADLKRWLNEDVYIQAMLQLPSALFKSEHSQKNILVLQNRNNQTQKAKETLIAELPSLRDMDRVKYFFNQFKEWKQKNLMN